VLDKKMTIHKRKAEI